MSGSGPRLGVAGQAAAIASGSLDPMDVLDGVLRAVEETEPALGAVIDVFADRARQALAAAPRGRLYGVPITLKDMLAVPWRAPRDGTGAEITPPGACVSTVYDRLTSEGAVVVGITNMHQLGVGSTGHISAFGPTANPWRLSACAGGSSGGAAASVAAGVTDGAIGSDGGGSIRIPAAWCGVTGLKPTWGAVPVHGYTGAFSTLGSIGPLANDAAGCRLLTEVLTRRELPPSDGDVRIGVIASYWNDLEPGVETAASAALAILGGDVAEQTLEGQEHIVAATILGNGVERLPSLTPDWFERMEPALHPNVVGLLKSRFVVSAAMALRVNRLRTLLRRELARIFSGVDVLAWPTVAGVAPPIERPTLDLPSGAVSADIANVRQCGLANLTGIPAISIPCGFSEELPVGLMLHAPWGREDVLLELADRFEAATERMYVDARPITISPAT